MAIDPDLFPVENLDLDRLYANLIETESTIETAEAMLTQDIPEEERSQWLARLASDKDMVVLLKELIKRKRLANVKE
jgi:hypothetical protein